MLCDLLTQYPLFVDESDGCFDVQGYVESQVSVRPDCASFVRMFIQTDMFDSYLRLSLRGGVEEEKEEKVKGKDEEKEKEMDESKRRRRVRKRVAPTPFEDKFNLSIARQLNILVAETGMSINVQKVGYLVVTHMELVDDTSTQTGKTSVDRPLKLKEQKRWIVLDRQRLTYYRARSTRRVKNTINLNPSTTRMSVSPPLPDDCSGLVVFTKPFTLKIESEESKEILYLRADDEISFREWHNAIQTRLMPADLRSKMRSYAPSRR
jgi:hypothetical protein